MSENEKIVIDSIEYSEEQLNLHEGFSIYKGGKVTFSLEEKRIVQQLINELLTNLYNSKIQAADAIAEITSKEDGIKFLELYDRVFAVCGMVNLAEKLAMVLTKSDDKDE